MVTGGRRLGDRMKQRGGGVRGWGGGGSQGGLRELDRMRAGHAASGSGANAYYGLSSCAIIICFCQASAPIFCNLT